jgi:hypothetical protein
VSFLYDVTDLAHIVGNRIYFAVPSQLSAYPCVVVKVADRGYSHNLAGSDSISSADMQLTALALYENQAVAAAEAIRQSFDGFGGTVDGVPMMQTFLIDESDDQVTPPDGSDNWIYMVTLTYRVRHRVPAPASTQANP